MSYFPGVQSFYSDDDDDRYFSYYGDFDDYDSDYLDRARSRARATKKVEAQRIRATQKAKAQRMLLEVAFGFTDKDKKQSRHIQPTNKGVTEPKCQISTLLETCARFVGQNLPFEAVQLHSQRIPEEVQTRVAYWSFPLSEERVLEYIKMMGVDDRTISRAERLVGGNSVCVSVIRGKSVCISVSEDLACVPHGRTHGEYFVKDVTQIGVYLTGCVKDSELVELGDRDKFFVCVQFSRGCITSTMCSCTSDTNWCVHVIALCIARIREVVPCDVHPPLGEMLNQFNRDQLQKMIQHFVDKLPLVGIPPMVVMATKMSDKGLYMKWQNGTPDITAGGNLGENPTWQIDEQVVIDHLNKNLQTIQDMEISTTLSNFPDFVTFLSSHDENVAVAFKWITRKISRTKPSSEHYCKRVSFTWSSHKIERSHYDTRRQLFLVLIDALQILLVDPFISHACKQGVMDSLLGNENFHEFVASVTYCGNLLTDIKLVSKEHIQPTVHFLQKVLCALQEDAEPKGQYCNKGSHDQDVCHTLFSCLVSILRYWLFHKQPANPAISCIVLYMCNATFQNPHLEIVHFEDFTRINKNLGNIPMCNLMRHGKVLVEYLIHSETQPQDVFDLVTRLLGVSSVALSGMLKSACKETWLAIAQVEEEILDLVKEYCSKASSNIDLAIPLYEMLQKYLCKDPGDAAFCWPWALLRMAALHNGMADNVKTIIKSFIVNTKSVMYWRIQKDTFPLYVLNLIRENIQSLLQFLFQNLPDDSAQSLFTTLSDAFPFPCDYMSFYDRSVHTDDPATHVYSEESEEGQSILPTCHCSSSLSQQVHEDSQRVKTDGSVQVELPSQGEGSRKIGITVNHIRFVSALSLSSLSKGYPEGLSFQLELLSSRIAQCKSNHFDDVSHLSIAVPNLHLETENGRKAFHYFSSNWKYCLSPSEVLETVALMFTASKSGAYTGFEEMSQLISSVVVAAKNCGQWQRLGKGWVAKIMPILTGCENPKHLLTVADTLDANALPEEMEQIGRGVAQVYNKMKSSQESSSQSEAKRRLKEQCSTILDMLVLSISKPNETNQSVDSESSLVWAVRYQANHRSINKLPVGSLCVSDWVLVVCDLGERALRSFLTVLQHYHRVKSLGKFRYSFCEDLATIWTEYRKSRPLSSRIVCDPIFAGIMALLVAEKEENAEKTVKRGLRKHCPSIIEEGMLLLASIYRPLGLDWEFHSFALRMAQRRWAARSLRQMIESKFVHVPLSALEIPEPMYKWTFGNLDSKGASRHLYQL